MPRSREELVEALRDWAQLHEMGDQVPDLVTDLRGAADLLDSLEERVEWRVVGKRGFVLSPIRADRELVERAGSYALNSELGTLQSRTVTETPWTDVEEGTDGC